MLFSFSAKENLTPHYSIDRKKRSFTDHESQRLAALQKIENFIFMATDMNGHDCVLRVMCEAAETPVHADGLLGEAINGMLLPMHLLDMIPEYGESDYLRAQRMGQKRGNCNEYHQGCPMTIFQVNHIGFVNRTQLVLTIGKSFCIF
jgi:hypothetical protein